MKTTSTICLAMLLTLLAASASAQVICPVDFPAASPVLSSSPDDIPSTNDHILTYTGAHAAGRANHNMSFMQTGPNEQKVWFFTDNTSVDHEHVYYNRRYRANSSSPWYWEFSASPAVGTAFGDVLYSASPRYKDTRTNTLYSYVMYQVVQPIECNTESAGYLQVVFSNDGICWTTPQWVTRLGGPMSTCLGMSNTVPVEWITAFDDGTDIKLIGVEGSIAYLLDYQHMDDTAVIGYSPATSPSNLYLYESSAVVNTGVSSPYTLVPSWYYSYTNRFQPYNYFMNVQAAFDPSTGDLYLGRAYPYPFDRGPASDMDRESELVPEGGQAAAVMMYDSATGRTVQVGGCNYAPATLPNRIQLYKMHIGSMSNFGALASSGSSWALLADLGNASGYSNIVSGTYVSTTPLTYTQTNAGRDYGSATFIRDGHGNLVRESGVASYFGGDTFELSKSNGPCRVTGLERETLLTVP
jgi:hypothetical protein